MQINIKTQSTVAQPGANLRADISSAAKVKGQGLVKCHQNQIISRVYGVSPISDQKLFSFCSDGTLTA